MTDFRGQLDRIRRAIPGALSASIMGMDGIPIDAVHEEEAQTDPSGLVVEYSALLEQVRKSAQMFAAGELEEVSIRAERLTCIMRPINREFFLALVIRPEASMGKSRYLLRIQAPKLEAGLS